MNPCLSPEQIEGLLAGLLGGSEREMAEVHVETCPSCQEKLGTQAAGPYPNTDLWPTTSLLVGPAVEEEVLGRLKQKGPRSAEFATPKDGPAPTVLRKRPEVPGYEILETLGRGGMGVVYKARQITLNRLVALKMILPEADAHAEERLRFLAEAEAVARLHHSNIVQIYETGEHEGCLYLALEYIDGGNLANKAGKEPQPARPAAALVETLARAVHYAHQSGIVHRDLKPTNILLVSGGVESGEWSGNLTHPSPLTTHQPKIADFGLAKSLESDSGLTLTGQVLGTPSYMAPEQAEGKHKEVGPASDIYALGAILYELLTGRPPFRAETPVETLRQVVGEEPITPRRLQPRLPRELEIICLKCLEKQSARRYPSAEALANDLKRFLNNEPIQARPAGPLERAGKWARRRPAAAALAGVLALVVLVGFPGVTLLWLDAARARNEAAAQAALEAQANIRAQAEQKKAEKARDDADTLRRQAEKRETRLALARGLSLCQSGELDAGLLWMVRSLELAILSGDRKLERAIRINLADWGGQVSIPGRRLNVRGAVQCLAFRPDGKAVLVAAHLQARQWDVATRRLVGTPLESLFHDPFRTNWAVAYSPDGKRALVGKSGGTAQLWDLTTGRMVGKPLAHGGEDVWAVAFSPDGKLALTGGGGHREGAARFWDAVTGLPIGLPLRYKKAISAVAFSPNSKTVLTGNWDNTAQLWDVASGKRVGTPLRHPEKLTVVAFSPDGKTLLTGARDGLLRLWDRETCQPLGEPMRHLGDIHAAAFSPDGRTILTGSGDGTARLWNALTRQPLGQVFRHASPVKALAFRADGRVCALGCADGSVRFWRMPLQKVVGKPMSHDDPVSSAAFSPDNKRLLTGSYAGVDLWEGGSHQSAGWLDPDVQSHATAWSPDGRFAATAGWTKDILLWDAADGHFSALGPVWRTEDHAFRLAFSRDGKHLLSVSENSDREVRVWEVSTRRRLNLVLRHPAYIERMALSPAGRLLATGCRDGTLHLWDWNRGRRLRGPLSHPERIEAVAWSKDGNTVATGCRDGIVRVWDVTTGRQVGPAPYQQGGVLAVDFSPDGGMLLTGGADRTARLWDAATGTQLGPPLWHADAVQAVAFRPDGKRLATGSRDRTAQLWEVPPAPLAGRVEQVRLWAEVLAGMELDQGGVVHKLDEKSLEQRRRRLAAPANAGFIRQIRFRQS